ncbi:MAG TPA: hypothetical protein VIM30_04155 [Candidatus Limnocylindrales bacterium]
MPRPRLVQSPRTNIARIRAASVAGSSRRARPSCSAEPLKSLSRLLQPPHATTSPAASITKYVLSSISIGSTWAIWITLEAVCSAV